MPGQVQTAEQVHVSGGDDSNDAVVCRETLVLVSMAMVVMGHAHYWLFGTIQASGSRDRVSYYRRLSSSCLEIAFIVILGMDSGYDVSDSSGSLLLWCRAALAGICRYDTAQKMQF